MRKLFLVDGSGFIFRAYHALPPLTRPDGTPVGAVYGFCNMLSRFLGQLDGHKILVVFDAGRQTFRQDIYPQYKAHRPEAPEDLVPQFPLFREACLAFGVPTVEQGGFEADDLIASYTEFAKSQGLEVVIVSSDKDLMQLVGPGVTMLDPIKNKTIDESGVFGKFGVKPGQVVDVQALAGDSSDNVPGVPGIGIKTAAELINAYGSLEGLLAGAAAIKQPKRRESLIENAELARISKKLVTLIRNIPLPLALESLEINLVEGALKTFLEHQGFKTLAARLGANSGSGAGVITANTLQQTTPKNASKTLVTLEDIQAIAAQIKAAGRCAIDLETTGLDFMKDRIVGVALAVEEEDSIVSAYIPLSHQTLEAQAPKAEALGIIKALCEDSTIVKIGHNIKFDMEFLRIEGIEVNTLEDTMVMSLCLDAGRHGHGLDELSQRHLGHKTITFADVIGSGKGPKTFDYVALDKATAYAGEDVWVTLSLYKLFKGRLPQEELESLYTDIERPMVKILGAMEWQGIKVDIPYLRQLSRDFEGRLAALEAEIYVLAGVAFNIGSPKQLGEVLFEKNNLPAPKKSKTGAYVTDADVLENLANQGHQLPAKVLEWRSLSKLRSTYTEALQEACSAKTGRVHTSFNMAGTVTGRLSSSNPNLQNIPIRTTEGRRIRQAFIACPGYKLVSLDYSQIELRLLAHMADVDALKQAFCKGEDIHKATAATIHDIPLEQVTPEQRRRAKAINFGIVYGISPFGLSQQLGCSTGEAAAIIKAYFEKYPGIEAYMAGMRNMARQQGYVTTLLGRRCHLPGINDKNHTLRQYAERQAINAPLQGSNADIIKQAMIKIHNQFKGNDNVHMLLQVHDELVFEIADSHIEAVAPQLKAIMEGAATLSVPLVVDYGVGLNWDEAH